MKFNRWLSIILVIIFSMTLAAAESNQIRFRRIQQPTARLLQPPRQQQPRQIFIKPQPQQQYSLQKSSDLRRINQQPRPRPLSSSLSNLNKNPTSLSSTSSSSSSWNTGRQKSERKVAWTPWSTPSSPSLFRSSSSSSTTPKINVIDTGNTRQESWNQRASDDDSPPGAYHWGYRWIDESGNQMFREETADGYGTVTGRYSFREYNGLIRIVEYIADENGYRTRIRSNEPGIVTSNPAGAQIIRFENENDIPA
uniref:Uncharacterized protein LOC113798307 n=1 Tax=Dermatophagoides pteronyssinus TaxID=6956 RepID=A0A6P6YIC6_DERPT|nr:uncharacterized protein LOC113798307 [Dermatophagoides pteronyssinus]